jgi:hypothetical protein
MHFTHSPINRRRTLALAAAFATAALVATSAEAYTPPKGTPDLAKMTLQPSDLAPGSTLLLGDYFDPGAGVHLRAEYNRDWGAASTTTGVKLAQIQTQITLASSTSWAQTLFAQLPDIDGTNAGRASLIADVDSGNGSSATLKNARFSKPRSIGAGQQSLYQSATITQRGSTLVAGFAWVRVDASVAFLVVVAPKPPLADAVTIALAKTVAAHMKSVPGS